MSSTFAAPTRKAEADADGSVLDRGSHDGPETGGTTPRWLASATAPPPAVPIQRQEEPSPPSGPGSRLAPPSLLQPRDPYERFRPDFGLQLRLDPELEARMLAQGRSLLSPASILASVAPLAPAVAVPRGAGSSPAGPAAGAVPGAATAPVPPQPAPAPAPPSPTPAPAAGASAEGTRPASPGDVMSAVLALPQVSLLLEDVQTQFTSDFSRYWRGASTGERVGFVTSSVVVGGAMLAPLLGFREPRDLVLPLLNDVVIPVPGLSGYGLEFRFGERDVMIGVHLDVGRLLPSIWGFGPASLSPIGGPPGSSATPPLSRKAEEAAPAADAAGVAAGVRAQAGRGSVLDESARRELEPALGTELADVRVHTDAAADTLARAVHARAFTSGRDLFFRSGRYAPATPEGQRLLAHELVHVGQQARGQATASAGSPVAISEPGDRAEREADRIAEDVTGDRRRQEGTSPEAGPVPAIQRQPGPGKAAATPAPVPSAAAQQMKPPPFTSYFDELVPAILEAAESNEKVGLERALWLITQAYGEQGPGVGLPSAHHNRLFNEQGAVEMEDGHIKRVLPNQESEGVKLYNLPQNESPERGKQDIRTSPTFGYDTPERSAHHHLEQMQSRWGGAWNALTAEQGSFEDYARALKKSGYARASDYDTYLINLQAQVRSQVSSWLRFRIPEMRDQRIPQGEAYLEFLREQRDLAARRAAEEPDPVGSLRAEVANYDGMIQGMEIVLADARAQLGRLGRFAGILGVKVPQAAQ